MAPINVHKASEKELHTLKGIGKITAAKIIELRQQQNNFTMEELSLATNVPVQTWLEFQTTGLVSFEKPVNT